MLNKGTEELVNLYNIVLIPSLKYGSVICLAFSSLIYFSVFTKKIFYFHTIFVVFWVICVPQTLTFIMDKLFLN